MKYILILMLFFSHIVMANNEVNPEDTNWYSPLTEYVEEVYNNFFQSNSDVTVTTLIQGDCTCDIEYSYSRGGEIAFVKGVIGESEAQVIEAAENFCKDTYKVEYLYAIKCYNRKEIDVTSLDLQ